MLRTYTLPFLGGRTLKTPRSFSRFLATRAANLRERLTVGFVAGNYLQSRHSRVSRAASTTDETDVPTSAYASGEDPTRSLSTSRTVRSISIGETGQEVPVTAITDSADAEPQSVGVLDLDLMSLPLVVSGSPSEGIAVDLTAILLKSNIKSPSAAVTRSVASDDSTSWYAADGNGRLVESKTPPGADTEITLLIRTPVISEPAWKTLLRERLGVDGVQLAGPSMSSGAILFVRTGPAGKDQLVAWCFGQGSRWIRRWATSPRFGLLAALNALAGSMGSAAEVSVGVTGASLAARDGNLRRASLTAAIPTTADAIPRIDTLADVLTAARVRTGHDVLGRVSAGRSLQFPAVISSISDFRRLSALVLELAEQDGYRTAHGWIDYIVPEPDDSMVEAVLDRIWRGTDDDGRPVEVEIAWWEDLRGTGSDHPVTHWLLAGEYRRKYPVRNLALTWPAIGGQLRARFGPVPGHEALATDIRFFSDSEEELGRCPVVELLTAELTMAGMTYVLVDGEVCRVDADFLAELDRQLQSRVVPSVLLPYRPGELEEDYNKRAGAATGMLVLDKKDIRPAGATQIEPCDLLAPDGSLYHVKRHTNAAGISHVVSQAVASATVLLRRPESQIKLAALIDAGTWGQDAKDDAKATLSRMPGSASRVPVIIVLVGDWTGPTIKSLSLLCRLALRTAVQRLSDLGYPVQIMLIERENTSGRSPAQSR